MRRPRVLLLAALLAAVLLPLALLAPRSAAAHAPGQSYIYLRIFDHEITVRLEVTTRDLNRALALGLPERDVERGAVEPHLDRIRAYVEPQVRLAAGGEALALRYDTFQLLRTPVGTFVQLVYHTGHLATIPEAIDVTYPVLFEVDPKHRNMLVIEHNWKTGTFNNESGVSLIFSPSAPEQTLELGRSTTLSGFVAFIRLGAWHIWAGLDHILFLIALVLPSVLARREDGWVPVERFGEAFKNILIIVTFFTVAHSITLSLAALEVVRLPVVLVETVIALSIGVAALHNLVPRVRVREWVIAFVFGLFHGLGFAFILTDLGLEAKYLVLSLLGFNVGVELGQIAIIAVVFPVLFALRTTRVYRPVLRYGSVALIAISVLWVAERSFDVPLLRQTKDTVKVAYQSFLTRS